jgi:molybdate transport system regulatory protein
VDILKKGSKSLKVKSKIWIEIEGRPVMGEGRRNLLNYIDKKGSISQAARDLGISYKKAWSYIRNMEDRLGIKLVEKCVGGRGGGGTKLTAEGKVLIDKYDRLQSGNREGINKSFRDIF